MNQDSIDHFRHGLLLLPEDLQPDVALIFEEISCSLPDSSKETTDWLKALPVILSSSPFIVGLIRRNPEYLTDILNKGLLSHPLDTSHLLLTLESGLADAGDEQEIMTCLRTARNQAMLHIAYRDLAGWASLDEVMLSLSEAARVFLAVTERITRALIVARHGTPRCVESNTEQTLIILGMGKLGGGELNFSSDVDLIFCYPENGQTDGTRPISNQEFFTRQAKLFIKLLTSQTADGFVYRVDTRLRPNGDSGPLCLSFSAMENYYQLHGRDWERYAFIKADVVAGDDEQGQHLLASLRPFIYRKYLDFSAIESIRDMKEMIERELLRKQEMQRNIKLGPGGIREVEFIAQAHQLIRGGRDPLLQQQSLIAVLKQLHDSALISDSEFDTLSKGYDFLRCCENRLQMYADQQTHVLPENDRPQSVLAFTMRSADWPTFMARLQQHTRAIHDIFHALFIETADPETSSPTRDLWQLWNGELDDEAACKVLAKNHYQQPHELLARLQSFRNSSLYYSLTASAGSRMDRLLPVLLHETGKITDSPDETFFRCLELLTAISRRPVYLSMLLDNEAARHQLIRLTAASPYASILIQRYPILLDDLLTGYSLDDFLLPALSDDLTKRLQTVGGDDLEQQMSLLREFHHSKLLAIASLEIACSLTAEETGRSLSAVAEVCVQESLKLAINGIAAKHGTLQDHHTHQVPFCVIAYGKLGSCELGFGSDLDLVFISASLADSVKTTGPRKVFAAQFFARIGQRLVHIMSTRTPAGRLYEIDMRLRPSGNSGPLVTGIRHMQRYQKEKAWTWEHQALVRARVIAGDAEIGQQFNTLREEILCQPRDEKQLRVEIIEMREKMRQAKKHSDDEIFDLKQGRGGIVDIEFMVQYMVLRWAHNYPQLTAHTETRALLEKLGKLGLIEAELKGILCDAFARWLSRSYQLKLNERPALIPANSAGKLPQQVTEIWNTLLLEQTTTQQEKT